VNSELNLDGLMVHVQVVRKNSELLTRVSPDTPDIIEEPIVCKRLFCAETHADSSQSAMKMFA